MSITEGRGHVPSEDDFGSWIDDRAAFLTAASETILAADDDRFFRKLTETLLTKSGYKVITAEDGEDAIRKFKTNREDIRLVILDVMMPGKSGCETYDAIRTMRPDIKVLFASGYNREFLDRKGMIGKELDFISKPMTPAEFLKKVREVLDK